MFGSTPELGPGHEKRDLGHLHQAQNDCNRRCICAVHLLSLPQTQVLNTLWDNLLFRPNPQGSSLFKGILSEEWNSRTDWWKVIGVSVSLSTPRCFLAFTEPFSGVAEICSHSQKWQSSTWSSCSTFTWKALSSSWCTTSKTVLALTMSSTPSTPSTLSLISSLWFVFERRSIPF